MLGRAPAGCSRNGDCQQDYERIWLISSVKKDSGACRRAGKKGGGCGEPDVITLERKMATTDLTDFEEVG